MGALITDDALQSLMAEVTSPQLAEIYSRLPDETKRSRQLRMALTGLAIVSVAAARSPEFATFSARLQSLSDCGCADAARMAEPGFFWSAARPQLLSCFHCAADCPSVSVAAAASAAGEHRGDCAVARLAHLLQQPGNGRLASEAGRAEASLLRQLRQLLARPALPIAESFGFQRNALVWALARNLVGPDGAAPADRAGQLMRLADQFEAQLLGSAHLLRHPPLEPLLAVTGPTLAESPRYGLAKPQLSLMEEFSTRIAELD